MSVSTEAYFEVDQRVRCKGDNMYVMPDLLSDVLEEDSDLNKSYPSAQKPKKKPLPLQRRYSGSLTGEYTVTEVDICINYTSLTNQLED